MIEKILTSIKLPYKLIDRDEGLKLIKINAKVHILYLYEKGNSFLISRDFFDYLNENIIPYYILCHDVSNNKFYYLKLNKKINWVKSCFQSCDKDVLYLGKKVLNEVIDEKKLQTELLRFK